MFSTRSCSICLRTGSRTSRKRSHLASNGAASATSGNACHVWKNTLSSCEAVRVRHTSSAVKDRIGAIRRASACVMCQSAVCAERLARESAPQV
ncbi:hypothetical protein D3C83_86820 [compost metagenome]